MSDGTAVRQDCPDVEDLSEVLDGRGSDAAVAHIGVCPRCQAAVDAYRRIDRLTAAAIAPPPYLAERIKAVCRQLPAERPMAMPWRVLTALGYAAAAGVAIVATVAVIRIVSGPSTGALTAAAPAPEVAIPVSRPAPELPPGTPENIPIITSSRVPLINDPHLARANASGGSDMSGVDGGFAGERAAVLVPARVRHVWVVKDRLPDEEKRLIQSLPEGSSYVQTRSLPGMNSYQVMMPDHRLQTLVDKLGESGWSLLSPAMPQPGEGRSMILTGRAIRYDVDLVSGAK